MWPKLQQYGFTTFRFPRKDKDWAEGEVVRIVYHPRSKDRKILGIAKILTKEQRVLMGKRFGVPQVTPSEAIADGFNGLSGMLGWIAKTYREIPLKPINKLTLIWEERNQ
jgi:hypothetical protein